MRFKDDCITEDQLLKWESVQRRMQVEQEETTKFAATKFGFKNPVILVDRGLPSAYISMVQYDLLMRKAALKDRISLDRYDGVIYMRTRTDEEQVLTFDDGDLSKRHRQEIQEDVDKLRERNEEVWQQHPNFVLIDALPHDKFRKRLQLAGEGLAKLLNFKLESGWDSSLDQTLPT
ncbi:unnamed protein product [Nippostrongylus brasiliensis]|uniref:DNK domain-containing protein n=1 Tax=Nippostrongylus brasiliensis TaxID=27835 RepID=A0A0N4Y487_NIPBR|nr:unnamed protein product [Nippostrongylus brasiliensis]